MIADTSLTWQMRENPTWPSLEASATTTVRLAWVTITRLIAASASS